ncbi:hypothetical protein AMAG_17783 [Allomyces macrogynus ATCC 38327]|uniref:Uncharacterized protein n=1 Tax=Allomyces macrogynus (strain ATCC 38327) TaxID=578462 RepID=A0A0L0RZB9_ALLM3|nr:hypothetical protein AMAG_17783 [Allomyces macrogynus ATCC 38327]|eukprot:KNE55431.1 hypothetical protein AMAG_17783 [Allomyces macrogynus ATCC 38327]
MLMKWRHTLQKTFIKDKSIGDAPRVQAATIATVEWTAVNATFKHMLAYLNGEHFNAALFNETKIPKVLRMIAQAQFEEAVTPVLEAQNVSGKVQDVLDALAAKTA